MSEHNAHLRQVFGLKICKNSHPAIRRIKRHATPTLHGNKFWGASYLLMDYFQQYPLESTTRVLEVGCGWGLAGIFLAKSQAAEVTSSDADAAVFPYLQLHAQLNGVAVAMQTLRFEQITVEQLRNVDVLIGADICFWDEMSDGVYTLIDRAINAGVKKIVIADPEREPFFHLADRCMDAFYAELEARRVSGSHQSSGCLLIIENA